METRTFLICSVIVINKVNLLCNEFEITRQQTAVSDTSNAVIYFYKVYLHKFPFFFQAVTRNSD